MRNIKARLHRPVAALRRVQDLAGILRAVAVDRNENRAAQIDSVAQELFDLALAALDGGPLPEQRDHRKAV